MAHVGGLTGRLDTFIINRQGLWKVGGKESAAGRPSGGGSKGEGSPHLLECLLQEPISIRLKDMQAFVML